MANNGFAFDSSGLRRVLARVKGTPERVANARKRALSTLQRRMKAETARVVSEVQINASARALSPFISVKAFNEHVSISAARTRLPLSIFKPRVSKTDGVRVTFFHARGEQHWPHAFKSKRDGKIKQRIPAAGRNSHLDSGPSGLVWRLPLTDRVGPSMARALGSVRTAGKTYAEAPRRDEVVAHLRDFARNILRDEIARLTKVSP